MASRAERVESTHKSKTEQTIALIRAKARRHPARELHGLVLDLDPAKFDHVGADVASCGGAIAVGDGPRFSAQRLPRVAEGVVEDVVFGLLAFRLNMGRQLGGPRLAMKPMGSASATALIGIT